MKTYASLFTGGGLADMGAIAAGYTPIWGNEYDPQIAEVAKANGLRDVVVADVLTLDPRKFERPDLFHASPPCTRASNANNSAELNEDGLKESPLDIAMAEKVAEFIRYLKPETFTLENVQGYRKFKSFALIIRALSDCGYMYDDPTLNSADFGVPQTRRRLFIRAVRGALLMNLPQPLPWVGWYAAIEDILDTLPESKFADWQLARLPEFMRSDFLCSAMELVSTARDINPRDKLSPSGTVTATDFRRPTSSPRAFLMAGSGNTNFNDAEPGFGVRYEQEPAHVISADGAGGRTPRAFLMSSENSGAEARNKTRDRESRAFTITGAGVSSRAFLVDGQESSSACGLQILQAADPAPVVAASAAKRVSRAWLTQGRVVSMTIQALARFQSVPDHYVFSGRKTLDGKIIGNGVPPLEYQRIAEAFL